MNRARLAALVMSVVLALPAIASAQTGFDVQRLKPAPAQSVNYFGLHQARVLHGGGYEVGLHLNYADDLLVMHGADDERIASIVSNQLTMHLTGGVGIADRLEIGLDIPVILLQSGDELPGLPSADVSDAGAGLGDIRIVPKVLLFGPDAGESGPAMAFLLDTYLPTAGSEDYQGEDFRMEPRLAFDYALGGGSRVGVNLGYLARAATTIENLEVDDTFTYGLGADVALGDDDQFHIVPEFRGETVVGASDRDNEESPLEWMLGARYFTESDVMIQGAFGTGIINGFGTPDWRLFFGIAYAPRAHEEPEIGDADGDGFADDVDGCPNVAEDFDDFEDNNGCPDTDDDRDGIPDTDDGCRLDPEDQDGFEDDDGCPDIDNDDDGILDVGDDCPDDAEDDDGFEDDDGCPDPDNDEDGILDIDDECPNDAEDIDGDRDDDGCPEGPIVTCEEIRIDEHIRFALDSHEIDTSSYRILDEVARVLTTATHIELIEVEGHTDDQGDDDHNEGLSERRARAVRNYLRDQDIDRDRLQYNGYGETQPVESNATEEGRAANRRVVFRIIRQSTDCD